MLGLGLFIIMQALKWEVCFSWFLMFDLVVLISNNIMRMFLVILDEVKVSEKLGFHWLCKV